jgi:hypothetical protein
MTDITDGERIAEERIAEAARTGQDWLDLAGLGLARLPERLAKLTWLQRLSIGNSIHVGPEDKEFIRSGDTGNTLSDLSPLSRLTRLNELYMDGTGCADLSPIAGVQHLRHLNCSDTKIEDLTPVIGLKELEHFDCGNTKVHDLVPLKKLMQLKYLECSNTTVQDLSPLLQLKRLYLIDFSGSQVDDLTPLAGLTELDFLSCINTKVRELRALSDLKRLEFLNLGSTEVQDLEPLRGLDRLVMLFLWGTMVSDITPLIGLKALSHLDLDGTGVSDLTPLVNLSELTRLSVRECEIELLPASLDRLQKLTFLDLSGNKLRMLPKELGGLSSLEQGARSVPTDGGLRLEGNPLEYPLPDLIAPGQPKATINVLSWLRGEPISSGAEEFESPVIPEQGAGPRVILDQTGRLVFAKPSDLDAKGNDRNRLEALHPALRETAADLAKALQDHPSNLRNERLLQKAEAYRALVDLPLDEVNFARLYGAGMQLLNAAAATREALEAGRVDVPDLTPLQNECLKNIEGLHPPFVLASRDGQEMLADQTTIKLTTDHVLAVKEAGTAFGEALLHRPDLAAPGIGQTIKDAATEIGQGGNPAREAVNAVSSARNTVVVAAWIATAASLTVGGAAYYGSPGAVLGMIPGVLLIESVKSSAIFKDITKRGAKTIDWSDEKIAALGARIKHWQELLGQNDGHLRKLAQVPKFEWLGPVIDWLKRNSPPDKKG